MDQPGRPAGSSLWNAQRAPRRVVGAPAAQGRRGAAPALSLPACGLRGSLVGPRDLESVINEAVEAPEADEGAQLPQQGQGCLRALEEAKGLVIKRKVWLNYHLLELQ